MGRLYLFVHGLTVIVERKDKKLEIVLPRVQGHVFRAGSWLSETDIEPGNRIELLNVTEGSADIYKTGLLLDVPAPHNLTRRGRAATLVVPKPNEILCLLLAKEAGCLVGAAARQTLADVLVFVYQYNDENQVLLDGHYWQPSSTGDAISLHVISTSEVIEGEDHEIRTQRALRDVFKSFPGTQYFQVAPGSWRDPQNAARFGNLGAGRRVVDGRVVEPGNLFAFALAELEHPAPRLQRLNRLGRMHQEKRRIEGLWQRPDPLVSEMSSCGSMTGT